MFQHREIGLNQTYHVFSTLLLSVLYWVWFLVLEYIIPGYTLTGFSNYFEYFLAILLGLQVSFLSRNDRDIFSINRGILESHRFVRPHILIATAITCLFLVLTKDDAISRAFLFTYIPMAYVAMVLFTRYGAFPLLKSMQRREHQKLLLIGMPGDLAKVESLLEKARFFGLDPVGMVTEAPAEELPSDLPKLGEPHEVLRVLESSEIDSVFILSSPRDRRVLGEWMRSAERHGCRLSMVNDLDVFLQRRLSYFRCDNLDLIELREEPLQSPINRMLKRAFDVVVSLPVAMLVLPPLMLLVWILQRLQAPGPLFFRQIRSGIDNESFTILKFRTMYDEKFDSARQASREDPRVFPAAKWLRRFSLDEFPQFFNVLTGQMSIVGPRPHMVQHDEVFARIMSNYAIRGFVKPGLSGLAQIRGFRGETATTEDVVRRVEADLEYIESWSIMLDVRIVWQTLLQMIRPPDGAR